MQDKKKDEGDQALIREQRSGQERSNGSPDGNRSAPRGQKEHRGNGEPGAPPSAGGVTRKQEQGE